MTKALKLFEATHTERYYPHIKIALNFRENVDFYIFLVIYENNLEILENIDLINQKLLKTNIYTSVQRFVARLYIF